MRQLVKVGGKELTWKEHAFKDHLLDFNGFLGAQTEDSVAYAVTFIVSPEERKGVRMKTGSDDQAKLYINGKEVYRQLEGRGLTLDEDEIGPITLHKGSNVLVFKVVNGYGPGPHGSLHFVAKDGHAAEGLQFRLEP